MTINLTIEMIILQARTNLAIHIQEKKQRRKRLNQKASLDMIVNKEIKEIDKSLN